MRKIQIASGRDCEGGSNPRSRWDHLSVLVTVHLKSEETGGGTQRENLAGGRAQQPRTAGKAQSVK